MEHPITVGANGLTTLLIDLNSDDLATYLAAREALLTQRETALPVLVEFMLKRTDRLGWRAASLVAVFKDADTIPAFVEALNSPNALIRQIAAQILGDSGDASVAAPLLDHLHDENLGVRTWVVESLGNLHAREAVQPLCVLLGDTDAPELQQSIIKALGRIGDTNAADCLVPFLNSPNHHVRSRARDIHRQLTNPSRGN